ncbi:MAG: hypothetical protein U9P49_06880 [Thermodesulfobacteriota bacterium]|nr:hypothetical protein [Thermodesulfobacteriota bacterium]
MYKKIIFLIGLCLLFAYKPSLADDTEIFSGGVINVTPNVLIIFDTSGSMADSVPCSVYDPSYDYAEDFGGGGWGSSTASYERYKVYYKSGSGGWGSASWEEFTNSTSDIGCADAKDTLDTIGHWQGYIGNSSPYNCGTSNSETLATGNFLNFLDSPIIETDSKINVARKAIKELLDSIEDNAVRFGLMRFNDSNRGGSIVAEMGSSDATIKTVLDIFTAHGATPLAESLAEAGLYFAGKSSWANPGTTYTSPIQWRCQKNYIILMTDGNSWSDEGDGNGDNIFTRADYINGNSIGDYDNDGVDPGTDANGGTHWLDDVAKFLHDEDLRIDPATDSAGESFDTDTYGTSWQQNIVTYTIGFATKTDDLLLKSTADDFHGHGAYYSSENSSQLQGAFSHIIGEILETNASFIAPVVPVSKMNKAYAGNSVYLALFRPVDASGFWEGNLKKFGLNCDGDLLQKDGSPAADATGQILSNASSCWSSADGSDVKKGGAGETALSQTDRTFYTYQGTANKSLTHSDNAFSVDNTAITATTMGVATDTEKDDLINYLTAKGVYAQGGTSEREWVLGDILHSKPAVMYDGNNTVIFGGANDGFLHTLVDDDKGTGTLSDDSVSEKWCFVPWDLLPNLHLLKDSSTHSYFVDGSPVVYRESNTQYVCFGLRRGGNKYYALKVGEYNANGDYITDGYLAPEWVWEISSSILGSETLAQSWSTPRVCTIATGGGSTTKVILLAGGYDVANEDLDTPALGDSKGRAVYAVDASTGILSAVINFNHSNYSDMRYSIVDLAEFDYDSDGLDDTIYAPSLGANLFVFKDRDKDGSWEKRWLFKARNGSTATTLLKFLYAPDVVLETFGDYVYIGTGDRAHPSEINTTNRFYAIKNKWTTPWTDGSANNTLTEGDLVDVTSYGYNPATYTALASGNGWFIKFDKRSGEKMVSTPIVFNKIVFFSTFSPDPGSGTDKCATQGLGGGRLYALNYMTGQAALNFDETNDAGGEEVLARSDRSIYLGTGIPSQPTLIVTLKGTKLLIGTQGTGGSAGTRTFNVPGGQGAKPYYWKQN